MVRAKNKAADAILTFEGLLQKNLQAFARNQAKFRAHACSAEQVAFLRLLDAQIAVFKKRS